MELPVAQTSSSYWERQLLPHPTILGGSIFSGVQRSIRSHTTAPRVSCTVPGGLNFAAGKELISFS